MKKRTVLWILITIVTIGLVGGGYGFYEFFRTHADLSKVKPDFTLAASDLSSAFENDETAATKKYVDKVVQVTGPVASVEMGSDSTINVTLRDEDALSGVICSFQGRGIEDVSVKKGDVAVIRGQCSGMLLDVLLNNCALVSKNKNP